MKWAGSSRSAMLGRYPFSRHCLELYATTCTCAESVIRATATGTGAGAAAAIAAAAVGG